jgi:hypothetical protein
MAAIEREMIEKLTEFSIKQAEALQEALAIMSDMSHRIGECEACVDNVLRRPYGTRRNPLKTRPRSWTWGLR